MATRKTSKSRIADLEDRIEELEDRLDMTSYGLEQDAEGGEGTALACSLPVLPKREFAAGISPERENAILSTGDKWVNGTNIQYYLLSGP